ncbi:MAG: YtxH domain-containing protein [Dehalococcoidales bacterium]|nr:YtxH domain-containing protein [Dehalococcoidales bacterium]
MSEREKATGISVGLLVGIALGLVIGLLYAPRPGSETRATLTDKAKKTNHKFKWLFMTPERKYIYLRNRTKEGMR